MFGVNLVAILLLLMVCSGQFLEGKIFSFLSFLGLGVPVLVIVNMLFLFYWGLLRKKWLLGSLGILIIGYFSLGTFYKFSFMTADSARQQLKVMSFNVRLFNKFRELKSETVSEDSRAFVEQESPDIICFQEPFYNSGDNFQNYPYRYLESKHMKGKGLLAIFSKYPIINQGLINLPRTSSNAVFADIVRKGDTIRVYNVHLESLGITPGQGVFRKDPLLQIIGNMNAAFQKQFEQAKVLRDHLDLSPYKNIVCGDLNNSQYSNVYAALKGEYKDTFLEKGSGFGRTYSFHGIPVRIDFILSDSFFQVTSHRTYDVEYSDHFPVMASFEWGSD